jgi:hypothetical protein
MIYTVVDEGYDVDVFRKFDDLWRRYENADTFLDEYCERPMTKSSLRAELRKHGEARLYEENNDWKYKVVTHK